MRRFELKRFVLTIGILLSLSLASAGDSFPPMGSEVFPEAGHCPVGPFGRDGDVGIYHGFCTDLKSNEICTAYLEGIAKDEILEIDSAKISFCKSILVR